MFSGLLGLVFNPSFWMALSLTAMLSFAGGVFKGWSDANVSAYRAQIEALEEAVKRREIVAKEDAERAQEDQVEIERLNRALEEAIHENENTACKLSSDELGSLRKLASGQR